MRIAIGPLWSFQFRPSAVRWFQAIKDANSVFVLCANSKNARDPNHEKVYCRSFLEADAWPNVLNASTLGAALGWKEMPPRIWENPSKVPTRGESLIRKEGGKVPLRQIVAVLELAPPYLAVVSA